MGETMPMTLGVRLTVVASQGEADLICSLLRAEGIKCTERMADSIESSGGRREILVLESDLASARELLAPGPLGASKNDSRRASA